MCFIVSTKALNRNVKIAVYQNIFHLGDVSCLMNIHDVFSLIHTELSTSSLSNIVFFVGCMQRFIEVHFLMIYINCFI